jgi:hypothetical protein
MYINVNVVTHSNLCPPWCFLALSPPATTFADSMQREDATGSPSPGYEVRFIDAAKGRGIFSTRPFKPEETVFAEVPAAHLQHYENRSQVVGTASMTISALSEMSNSIFSL